MQQCSHNDRTEWHRTRLRIAQEAARLMATEGVRKPEQARRKAAARLGVRDPNRLPDLSQIQQALHEYQRLYATTDNDDLQRHRRAALRAMAFLSTFQPRLTGVLLEGIADAHSPIVLHLHCDDIESVGLFLEEHGIPAGLRQQRIMLDATRSIAAPAWTFIAEDLPFELVVLPVNALRQPPLDPLDRQPMRRLSSHALERLIAESDAPDERR